MNEQISTHSSLSPQVVKLIHDLRNGLASLRAAGSVLQRAAEKPELVERIATGVQEQVNSMVSLINDFVAASKAAEGSKSTSVSANPATIPSSHATSLQVLVVDDNPDAARTLEVFLRMEGHRVLVATESRKALALAEQSHPDVVLLDLTMPEIDGFELARRIRSQPWGARLRMFAISGWISQDVRERAAASGIDEQLTKPIDVEALKSLLSGK